MIKDDFLNLFVRCDAMQIGHSPLLTEVDVKGEDDETIHASWTEEDGTDSINIPHKNLVSIFKNQDDSYTVEDVDGDQIKIKFYTLKPLH
ncbi:hypothetical protein AB4254_08145 [Vibrio breoganii]